MIRINSFLAAAAFLFVCSQASALWSVYAEGSWPKNWPKELETLRTTSSTIRGGIADLFIHHIPFTTRDEFEAAWPHILQVKTKGAPIFLVRSPGSHWHFGQTKAGVLVHCPFGGIDPTEDAGPIPGVENVHQRWMRTTYVELIVDGDIIDLNRISLPSGTPIIDQRFQDSKDKAKPK